MSRRAARIGVAVYCIVLFLALDLIYSQFFYPKDANFRTTSPEYHHRLRPNVTTTAAWGRSHYAFHVNSLGFRDSAVRVAALKPEGRRIVLLGDSFTEAVGVTFEESFAGLLARAGNDQPDRVEVLNAGVVSYSPVLYYKKIKTLLDQGLVFHELVVLSDISDVHNEATSYFCVDDDPAYLKHCKKEAALTVQSFLHNLRIKLREDYFVITYFAVRQIRIMLGLYRDPNRRINGDRTAGWTISGFDVGRSYEPLGVEGGIARSLGNMQALADLLRANDIALTIVVYPWPMQLQHEDRDSRQVRLWRDFCTRNCKAFINLFPAFFAEKDADRRWVQRLFIDGDQHYSAAGNYIVFRELAKHLFPPPPAGSAAPK